MLKKTFLFFVFLFCISSSFSQDIVPRPTAAADTIVVDTVVIRREQDKVKYILRGVNLRHPKVSFNNTKPLAKKIKRFRVPSFWEKINLLGINVSQVAFVNWNAGGNNSITGLGNLKFERNYKFRYVQWKNILELRYGLNAQEGQKLRKTDDAIRFSSTFGFRRDTISNWYYSVKANFNTQFADGYKYPNRDNPISRFMSPGYFFLGAGTSYIQEDGKFNLYISPLTAKSTFVLDQDLADKGSFGVEKAILDDQGNIIQEGRNYFLEVGFLITNTWEAQIAENIGLNNRVSLYTDYLRQFGNIDVDWQLDLSLRVNKYIATTLGTHLIYDDDILFDEVVDADGLIIDPGEPRIQFKQLFGVGVSYNF
ncbi:MAG: DUF3078 domain-containing protein [Aurantibacter sp.]